MREKTNKVSQERLTDIVGLIYVHVHVSTLYMHRQPPVTRKKWLLKTGVRL